MVRDCACGFCGRSFAPDAGQPTCLSCPLKGGCHLVRCPHCGYENPMAPAWLTRIRDWFATPEARRAGYDAGGDWTDEAADTVRREVSCP
jgi:hypothetical protein